MLFETVWDFVNYSIGFKKYFGVIDSPRIDMENDYNGNLSSDSCSSEEDVEFASDTEDYKSEWDISSEDEIMKVEFASGVEEYRSEWDISSADESLIENPKLPGCDTGEVFQNTNNVDC